MLRFLASWMPVTPKLGEFGLTGINCIFLVLPRYINLSLTLISPLLLFFSYCFSDTSRGVVNQDKPYFAHQSFPFLSTNNNVDSKHNLSHPILLLVFKDCLTSFCLISVIVIFIKHYILRT